MKRPVRAILVAVALVGMLAPSAAAVVQPPAQRARPTATGEMSRDTRVGVDVDDIAPGRGPIVFVDALKQALPWASDAPFVRDADGNVASLAPGHHAETLALAGAPAPSGVYTLLYEGEGTFEFPNQNAQIVERVPGRMLVRLAPGTSGIRLRLVAVTAHNYPHAIRLVLPGFADTYRTQPFYPSYLGLVRRFDLLRFARWSYAASSARAEWEQRTTPSRFSQVDPQGVALEYQIALANEAAASPWFTIPAGATDAYVSRMADLVHRALDPRLTPVFEYGDEAWRTPTPAALAAATARAVRVMALVARAFGPDAGRAARVLSVPAVPAGSAQERMLDETVRYAATQHAFDALAVAGNGTPFGAVAAAARAAHAPLFAYAGGVDAPASPAVRAAYDAQLEAWHDLGGAAFVASSLVGPAGLVQRLDQSTATAFRLQGVADYAFRHPAIKLRPLPASFNAALLASAIPAAPASSARPTAPPSGGVARTVLAPSVTTTTFAPPQIANLVGWFDGSDATSVVRSGSVVTSWNDKSGGGNTVVQATSGAQPGYTTAGINGLPSLTFNGKAYLLGTSTAFSNYLNNESTVFTVTNQAATAQTSAVLWSGAYLSTPRYKLSLTTSGQTVFDFNGYTNGLQIAATDVATGPAIWTTAGSISNHAQFLNKDGNRLASGTAPVTKVSNAYPLAIGGVATSTQAGYRYTGQIGEVVVYNRYLSAAETAQVEGYLACKWGLQNRLPANHPYRATCPQGGAPTPLPTATPVAGSLASPPELRSQNGQLVFNVTAQQDPVSGNPEFAYNGGTTPPTLRLLPGDTLVVNLTNALPAGNGTVANNVNLHYHGLHVSPNAPGDDSIDMEAAPGQVLQYQVAIPATHAPGLYWYHSHAHGEAERQNLAGMSGALVIDGIAQYAPAVANMPERILIARDAQPAGVALPAADRLQLSAMRYAMQHRAGAAGAPMRGMTMMSPKRGGRTTAEVRNPFVVTDPNFKTFAGTAATDTHCQTTETAQKVWTLNGQTQPSIGIRPGEQQFWRMVNAGSDTYLDVQVDGTQMQIVALDGMPLSLGTNTPSSMSVTDWVLPPSSRAEFIVTGPPSGTTAYLRTNCFDAGAAGPPMPAAILASLDPAHSPTDLARVRRPLTHERTPAVLRRAAVQRYARQHSAAMLKQMAAAAPTVQQSLYYSDQNTINGVAYDPSAPPQFYAQSGTVQEWTIYNNSDQVHTFHIHQIHFLVEAINGVTQPQQYLLDNVNVPAQSAGGPGTVKLLLDFSDPLIVGTFLLHCHILSHEDAGMMAKIQVGTAPPLSLSANAATFASPTAAAQTVSVGGGQAPYGVNGCGGVANASVNGSTVTIAPAGAGSCVLTVTDSSGLSATVSVTVNAPPPPMTTTPNAVSFSSPGASPVPVAVNGGTAPYGTSGCTGVASARVSGSVVSIAPQAAGTCTLTVRDAANDTAGVDVSVNAVTTSRASDNLTFHHDALRTGWSNAETTLTSAAVSSTAFAQLAVLQAPAGATGFGKVYAQPLFVTNETVADGTAHNLVIVATETDQVYAFDDRTLQVVWHRDLTDPAHGITQQQWTDTTCDEIQPDVGITGTPVIDRSLDRLYLVAATNENSVPHMRIHALSLKSGAEATDPTGSPVGPVEVAASVAMATSGTASTSAQWNNQRAALLEANGNVYVSLASHCDHSASTTHGWVLSYSATTLQNNGNLLDLTNANLGNNLYFGSIWMSGYGPAADAQGNIYFATGNGPWNGTTDFSMSVLKVPGNLDVTKASYFTPIGEYADSKIDGDLGSGGVMLLPDQTGAYPHLLVQGGKKGAGSTNGGTDGSVKYLLNRDNLGGQQTADAGALWKQDTGGPMWGGPAYFADAHGNQYVYYGGGRLTAPFSNYLLGTNPPQLTLNVSAPSVGCLECRNPGGSQPVVSSNGTTDGSAVVWALRTPHDPGGPIVLYAFDAVTMAQLASFQAGVWNKLSTATAVGGALVSPLVANGRVYVPADGTVTVFGLTAAAAPLARHVVPISGVRRH